MVLEKVYDELISMIEDLQKQISGGVGDSVDYDTEVTNRPKVNNITLSGNKKSSDLKISYSMTEDDYEDITPNAESIYCLQENESTSHIDATTDAATLTWVQDGGTYTSTYLIRMDNAIEITVTVEVPEGVTYEVTGSGIDRTVTFATETDPAEITGDFTIEADSVNDVGVTRIVKNGVEFGKSVSGVTLDTLWSGTQSGAATDVDSLHSLYDYDAVMCAYYSSDDSTHKSVYTPVSYLYKEDGDARWLSYPSYGNRYINLLYDHTKPTKINVTTATFNEYVIPVVTEIIGIKY